MDPFGNDEIARLLRLKRYEQPPPDYFENFLSEFRRRQRDELRRQPVWRICFECAYGFPLRHNARPYFAGVAVVMACAAVISIRIHQQSSPVPSTPPANTERGFNFAPAAMPRTFNAEPILPLLPPDLLRSDEFDPLQLEWELLDDQPLL